MLSKLPYKAVRITSSCSPYPAANKQQFDQLAANTDFCLTCIGSITPKRLGLRVRTEAGATKTLPVTSYEHFLRPSSRDSHQVYEGC
jgi:hypothetical protein